jgi:hypothetical protein
VRPVRRVAHREPPREVAVRPGGVLSDAVSQPAHQVRQAAAATPLPPHRQQSGDRTAVLRPAGGKDTHRDVDTRHVTQREQLQLAVHELDVTQLLATARHYLIDLPR